MGVQAKMVIVKYEAAQESKPEPRLTRKVMAYKRLVIYDEKMHLGNLAEDRYFLSPDRHPESLQRAIFSASQVPFHKIPRNLFIY